MMFNFINRHRINGGIMLVLLSLLIALIAVPSAMAHGRRGRDRERDRRSETTQPRNDDTETADDTNNDDDVSADMAQFLDYRTLDGSGNNLTDATLGMAGLPYGRITAPVYADGIDEMALTVDPRFVSNRIYNDQALNLFSESGVTHWGFVWGQFIDHSMGLRATDESEPMMQFPFNADDPLEDFTNDLGALAFTRSAAAAGTGSTTPRDQINTLSPYLDAGAVYGVTAERLDWLRVGSLDGNPDNNQAELLLSAEQYLPSVSERGDASNAPSMNLMGPLRVDPSNALVAGDVRANENLGLTAIQTLFAREHNRIVSELSDTLTENVKFEIARRVVAATQQFITYSEFLPAFGIDLPRYTGYDATVDPTVANEFATVGYRAHSMIHGEFEMAADAADYTAAQLAQLEEAGIEIERDGDEIEFAIPLNVAFGRPHLLEEVGLDAVLLGLASEAQYANDETIDNQLRSVLFQIPAPNAEDPAACLDGELLPDCYTLVNDLGVLDMLRAYDHGIPNYNDLREAYGLPRVTSFTQLTGESTAEFPDDPLIDADDPLNDRNILDVVTLIDADGNVVSADDPESLPVEVIQRTTLAARLAAIYGSVDNIDAFTGMMSEPHIAGTEFGPLQLAMWEKQFTDLRDGDRFFYQNDPVLDTIRAQFGINYRQTLATVIANNTDYNRRDVPANVFVTE